jgi:hypothetical protein
MLTITNVAYTWKKVDLISKHKIKMKVKGSDNGG